MNLNANAKEIKAQMRDDIKIKENDIAVIGMSCKVPGANNVDQFWENLKNGTISATHVPDNRWGKLSDYFDADKFSSNKSYSAIGGFISDIDKFDAKFFSMPGVEAVQTDPHQRLFLECAYKTIEDAGYASDRISNAKCAVFAGAGLSTYHSNRIDNYDLKAQAFWGRDNSVLSARIARSLNLKGPNLSINASCSSSLVAVHLGCQSLITGESELVLAGGVYLLLTPMDLILTSKNRMLSPTGTCLSFNDNADGFFLGEGVGAVLLKKMKAAVIDRDNIYGVIKACAVNHEGKTNYIIDPNAESQREVIENVYRKAHINPETISYIEAQSSGSKFGDALEIDSLTQVFSKYTQKKQFCAIGSVKANIGNLVAASSVIGLIKILLCMKNKKLAPTISYELPSKDIEFSKTPFYVNKKLEDWTPANGNKRLAALNAFGMSGTNVHTLIEEYENKVESIKQPYYLILISAKNENDLKLTYKKLLTWLKKEDRKQCMGNIAYTLSVGRRHYILRSALIVRTISELMKKLDALIKGKSIENYFIGKSTRKPNEQSLNTKKNGDDASLEKPQPSDSYDPELYKRKLIDLAQNYVKGIDYEWERIGLNKNWRLISMPTYPLSSKSYWKNNFLDLWKEAKDQFGLTVNSSCNKHDKIDNGIRKLKEPIFPDNKINDCALNTLRRKVGDHLMAMMIEIFGVDSDTISVKTNINEYGLNSVQFVEYTNKICDIYEIHMNPSIFFSIKEPTLAGLSEYLIDEHETQLMKYFSIVPDDHRLNDVHIQGRKTTRLVNHSTKKRPLTKRDNESIAIIGMNGIMPKSSDLTEFWGHLVKGHNLISEVPDDRWSWENFSNREIHARWGGFIKNIDKFDASFFNISPKEAHLMDPQQRLFLQSVWSAIEDAGYKPSDLSGTDTGIFVGVASHDYLQFFNPFSCDLDPLYATGTSHSILANRVSFLLNTHGPSEPIDTACSSSLVAIHKGIESIRQGHCRMAIVGGVNLIVHPGYNVAFSRAGMLSADGKCKTFDHHADGYVRGEGVVALLLKPLQDAIEDGDHIYGKIKGSAINHGGHSNSLTSPNGHLQEKLLIKAYTDNDVDPLSVSYIETHGTGTSLGDPVEVNSLVKAFEYMVGSEKLKTKKERLCTIGSVKTNIGHLEAAAGIASVIKILLSFQNKIIPPSIHFDKVNPYIDLKDGMFNIVDKAEPWVPKKDENGRQIPRRAGVSSFGFGGVNAHVILEEHNGNNAKCSEKKNEKYLFVLSAKSEPGLKRYARKFINYLKPLIRNETKNTNSVCLVDCIERITYTMQVGREAYPIRMATVVQSINELFHKLSAFYEGKNENKNIYYGIPEKNEHKFRKIMDTFVDCGYLDFLIKQNKLDVLALIWTIGIDLDWKLLYQENFPKRISLPTYPFDGEPYWINKPTFSSDLPKKQKRKTSVFQPEIEKNTVSKKADKIKEKPMRITLRPLANTSKQQAKQTFPEDWDNPDLKKDSLIEPSEEMAEIKSDYKALDCANALRSIEKMIKTSLAEALMMREDEIDINKPFVELGLDSISGVVWIKKINKVFGTSIQATKVYDYPDIRQFAILVEKELSNNNDLNQGTKQKTDSIPIDDVLRQIHQGRLDSDSAIEILSQHGYKEEEMLHD